MAMSGIEVSEDCLSEYKEVKMLNGKKQYLIMHIADDLKTVVPFECPDKEPCSKSDREEAATKSEQQFRERMKECAQTHPHKAVLGIVTLYKKNKVFLVSLIDDDGPIKSKMLYATVVKALPGMLSGLAATKEHHDVCSFLDDCEKDFNEC